MEPVNAKRASLEATLLAVLVGSAIDVISRLLAYHIPLPLEIVVALLSGIALAIVRTWDRIVARYESWRPGRWHRRVMKQEARRTRKGHPTVIFERFPSGPPRIHFFDGAARVTGMLQFRLLFPSPAPAEFIEIVWEALDGHRLEVIAPPANAVHPVGADVEVLSWSFFADIDANQLPEGSRLVLRVKATGYDATEMSIARFKCGLPHVLGTECKAQWFPPALQFPEPGL